MGIMKTEAISCEPSSHKLENRGYERRPLSVIILSKCEGFAAVMENTVKCHPESNYKKSSATKQLSLDDV